MRMEQTLYHATNHASLLDYAIFNRDKDNQKNEFLSKLSNAVRKSQWFDVVSFSHLRDKKFTNKPTHVPKVDEEVKRAESQVITTLFNEEEQKTLVQIIQNLNSHGVIAIKELRDDQRRLNKPQTFATRFLSKVPFF